MDKIRHIGSIFIVPCSFRAFFLLVLLFNLTFQSAKSQTERSPSQNNKELGLPFIQNYRPDEYGADSQNWVALQSKEGFLYFGNNEGVLEYDGVSWRLIQLPNMDIVRSLAISKENRIYVGGYNELGYLAADTQGKLQFVSLKEHLPEGNQEFQGILNISIIAKSIYFQSREKLFKWSGGKFKILEPEKGFNFSKTIREQIYVVESNSKLQKLVADKFEEVINVANVGAQIVTDILPYKKNQLLVLTFYKGLYVLENGHLSPLNKNLNKYLIKNFGRRITKLSNGKYLIATFNGGIVLLDAHGNLIKAIDKTDGLIDNRIYFSIEDRQKGIWLATNYGISRVELLSPYTIFDDRHGINGYVNRIFRHGKKLYAANYYGVLRLTAKGDLKNGNAFSVINESSFSGANGPIQAFYFMAIKDTLFSASRAGVHIIVDHKIKHTINYRSSALLRSKKDSNRIYIGLFDGLASLKYSNGKWKDDGRINGIKDDIREIVEDENGNLWLESQVDGVWKINFSKNFHDPEVKHFKAKKELPKGILFLKFIKGEVLFNINNHVYKYNEELDSIVANPSFGKMFGLPGDISVKKEDENGDIWMFAQLNKDDKKSFRIKATKNSDNSYTIKKIIDERILADVGTAHYTDSSNIVWYGGSDGIIRHDLNIESTSENDFNTYIRKVIYRNDSLLFGGTKTSRENMVIPYKNNAFRFEYAATSFDDESKNQFQVYLEGFDTDWSSWTSETEKDYTNIPAGDYSFKVRSKNIFNHIGQEDSYAFTILPPWYQTWWMYLIYGLAAIALTMLISQWRSKELQKKNIILESVIKKRTVEIQHKNELLSHQTEKLMQLNDAKTRLYTNVTHEFRTPLTVILGMADALKTDAEKEEFKLAEKPLKMIKRNGEKLLRLVTEMLDLAKLESGNMEVRLVQADVIPFVKYLSESFHSLAEERKINLTVYSEIDALEMDFDVDKLASIISNLLSNAIKFTPENGKIIVHLNKIQQQGSDFFAVKVKDNGQGISEEELPNVFDRFHQADAAISRPEGGTGIGLALVKELVELMKGTISVESTLRKGSVFAVQIPITNTAIKTTNTKTTVENPVAIASEPSKTEQPAPDDGDELPLALIIEDNEDVAHYLRTCLKGKYQTLHAINGIIGIEMAYEKIPDIIISDVMMPGKDGFEVCETLKTDERTDHIPIILLTAKVTMKDRLTGLSHGADAYLAKPFVKEELFTRLDQLIALRDKMLKKIAIRGFGQLITSKEDSPETKFIKKVVNIISEEMHRSTFGPVQLAQKLSLSESQIYRKLKAITNISTAIYIRSFRLQKAKEMLKTTSKTVSEIAYDVGFNDPSWFSRAFKEEFGSAPNDIRK